MRRITYGAHLCVRDAHCLCGPSIMRLVNYIVDYNTSYLRM